MNNLNDNDLILKVAEGHRISLGILYERHDRMVKGVIGRFAPEISYAERDELVQEIFLAVRESARKFPQGAVFRSWLFGIVANKTRQWRRNTWVRRRLLNDRKEQRPGMAKFMSDCPEEKMMLRQQLQHALAHLPHEQREVFVLHAAEGFSGDEISNILGIRAATVRTRLYRARKNMVASLGDDTSLWGTKGEADDV